MDYFKNYINFEELGMHVLEKVPVTGQRYAKFCTNINFHGDKGLGDKICQHCHNEQLIFVLKIRIFLPVTRIVTFCTFVCLKVSILNEKQLNFTINARTIPRLTINISFFIK